MARKQRTVIEVQCDRCTRTEERDDNSEKDVLAFEGRMFGLAVRFEDLCTPCTRTVKNHLEQIGKKLDGVSPDRVAKSPEEGVTRDGPPQDEERSHPVTKTEVPAIQPPLMPGEQWGNVTKR